MITETTPAAEVIWRVKPGDTNAHAFPVGPGWMHSRCDEVRWTVALQEPPEDASRCPSCADLVDEARS